MATSRIVNGETNIEHHQNALFEYDVQFKLGGVPVDITSSTSTFIMKVNKDQSAASITGTAGIKTAATGIITIAIPMPIADYKKVFYDVVITLSSGEAYTLLYGQIKFIEGIA